MNKVNDKENLELEIITLNVESAGQEVNSVNARTKTEHKKIKGIAILSKGGYSAAEVQGLFSIKIDRNAIVSDSAIPKFLFEVSHSKNLYDAAYECDIDINSSDIDIKYTDGSSSVGFVAYGVSFILICEKK